MSRFGGWVKKSIKILQQTNTAMELFPFFERTFHDVHMWTLQMFHGNVRLPEGKCSCCEFLSVGFKITFGRRSADYSKSFKTMRNNKVYRILTLSFHISWQYASVCAGSFL